MLKIPYFLVMIYPLTGFLLNEKKRTKNESYGLFNVSFIWVVFFLFAALRGNGDGDYFNYLSGVPQIDSISKIVSISNYPFEIGFRLIAYINNALMLPGQFTMIILSLISMLNYRHLISKFSDNIWLSWFLYFPFLILFDMHHTRNAVAMSFIARFFFAFVIEEKGIKSFIWAILAFTFHKSSLFGTLVVTIYGLFSSSMVNTFVKPKVNIPILGSAIVVSLFNPIKKVINLTLSIAPRFKLVNKLKTYLENDRWSYPFKLYDPRLLFLMVIYYFGVFKVEVKTKEYKHYLNMTLITLLTMILLSESTVLTMRFHNFFNVFTIFLVPYILLNNVVQKKFRRLVDLLIIGGSVIYFIALIYKQVPYLLFFL